MDVYESLMHLCPDDVYLRNLYEMCFYFHLGGCVFDGTDFA